MKSWMKWGGAVLLGTAISGCFIWAYWPTLIGLVAAWEREPDYSHGYLVVPLSLCMLWARRDRFPTSPATWHYVGFAIIALSLLFRCLAGKFYLDALDGWSMLVWLAGIAWLFGGMKFCRWTLPSIAFLWFMIPLPFRIERWVSLPLQGLATKFSGWTLQFLGQPALVKNHTILLGEHKLEVEQACSGLRIFMGIAALAFAYVIFSRRAWWEKTVILISTIPIALIANTSRIVVTGMLYQYASSDAAKKFSHDMAGWVMIPFAAALFGLELLYLCKITQEVEQVDVTAIWKQNRSAVE